MPSAPGGSIIGAGGEIMKKLVLVLTCVFILALPAAVLAREQHSIVAGDTLRKLAVQYDTTVLELLDLNPGITPDNLQIGQKITLPTEALWSYHIVQPGDNARSLASQYRVPLQALRAANGLEGNQLRVGEMIRIPMHLYQGELKQTTHTVEIGDTLYKLAQKYEVTLAQLVEWNNIKNLDAIFAGQTLIVG